MKSKEEVIIDNDHTPRKDVISANKFGKPSDIEIEPLTTEEKELPEEVETLIISPPIFRENPALTRINEMLTEEEFTGYPFPVFGVPLEKLSSPDQPLPYFIRITVRYLLSEQSLSTQGLLRIPGSVDEIQYFRKLFDEGKEVDFKNASVHDIAGLLKEFLRKMPEPLIPTLYNARVRTYVEEHRKANNLDERELLEVLREVIEQLPQENLSLLAILIRFLSFVVFYSDINSMNIDNVIKCIVPTVGCYPAIFYHTINNYDYFFSPTAELKANTAPRLRDKHTPKPNRFGNRRVIQPTPTKITTDTTQPNENTNDLPN